MTGPLPATQRGTVLAGVKAKPCGWPTASPDPGCGRHPANRRRNRVEERARTKIRQSEVSTLLGDCRRLLTEVWGPNYRTQTNYLRVYLAQLRQKLEPEPARPRYLITEPGMGYRFEQMTDAMPHTSKR